ncbi:MAG TPA: DUF835 domain-containing protein [Thermoplasmata archaeon]|nr:DUF835 domain-containing protein [Thermoplasmata archaeon]
MATELSAAATAVRPSEAIDVAPPLNRPTPLGPAETPSIAIASAPTESPAPPAPPAPRAGLAVSSGTVANDAWRLFLDATGAGHRGLCLSREFPDRMRALLGPRDVTVWWFSNAPRPDAVKPGDLAGIETAIRAAIESQGVRAIYLEHVEYLVRVNSLERVLAFLRAVDEALTHVEGRGWVPLNPDLVDPSTAEQLGRAFALAH